MPSDPSPLDYLDSVAHKLKLADYHRRVLQSLFLDHPHGIDYGDDEDRTRLEAHLEALAFVGTAATEKVLRAFAPDPTERTPVPRLILAAQAATDGPERALVDAVAAWYSDTD